MQEIENWLRDRIGLNVASVGSSYVQRTVRSRMKTLGVKRLQDYKRLLGASATEWAELVEGVVVGETWFFRDGGPFAALAHIGTDVSAIARRAGPMRLLSIACASGEEPYSMAMALLDAGMPAAGFAIDAVDISARSIEKARRAVYRGNSFRGRNLAYRERYFRLVKDEFVLSPLVRQRVNFIHANILDGGLAGNDGCYEGIFCRNLLIYFTAEKCRAALNAIERLLAPAGAVFVGAAEQALLMDFGFVSARWPMAFACLKAGDPDSSRSLIARPANSHASLTRRPRSRAVRLDALKSANPAKSSAGTVETDQQSGNEPLDGRKTTATRRVTSGDLESAKRLADAGRLSEAARICQDHILRNGPSAQGYYLLGLTRDAEGDPGAADLYRKALYLEPEHAEALLQLSLWMRKNGNRSQAALLMNRAKRAREKAAATA